MSTLNIALDVDPTTNSITYKINNDKEGTLLDGSGKTSNFAMDLNEIMQSSEYTPFIQVYTAYHKQNSTMGRLKSWIPSFSNSTVVHPETPTQPVTGYNAYAAKNNAIRHIPNNIGGKKSKSRRSYNANKTLKNRK
jgi:hypothetical protein